MVSSSRAGNAVPIERTSGVRRREAPPPRVLIIDDDPLVRMVLERFVTRLGYVSRAVSSPFEALEAFDDGQRFDVVLCDIVMPGMAGNELLDLVMEQLPAQGSRFVLISSETSVVRAAAERHGVRYADKPVRLHDVADAIQHVLAGNV